MSTWHGYTCPRCGKDDQLRITATTTIRFTEEGSEEVDGHEWTDQSDVWCLTQDPDCGWFGKVIDLNKENEEETE